MATRRQEKIKQLFENHGITLYESDLEKIGDAFADTLNMIADDIEEKEPYATNSIRRLREAASDVESEINADEPDTDEADLD